MQLLSTCCIKENNIGMHPVHPEGNLINGQGLYGMTTAQNTDPYFIPHIEAGGSRCPSDRKAVNISPIKCHNSIPF